MGARFADNKNVGKGERGAAKPKPPAPRPPARKGRGDAL